MSISTNWPQQSLCHIFHIMCLAYSQMTKNAPKFYTYMVHNSGLAHSQVIHSTTYAINNGRVLGSTKKITLLCLARTSDNHLSETFTAKKQIIDTSREKK
jgi:hypothetical protein